MTDGRGGEKPLKRNTRERRMDALDGARHTVQLMKGDIENGIYVDLEALQALEDAIKKFEASRN